MCRSKKLHLFEFFTLGFFNELCYKEDAEYGEEGIDGVSGADANAVFTRKHREAPSHNEVCTPLGEAANGDSHGTDTVVEHFAKHHPHDRTPRHGEERDVKVGGNQGDNACCIGEASIGIGIHEAYCKCA